MGIIFRNGVAYGGDTSPIEADKKQILIGDGNKWATGAMGRDPARWYINEDSIGPNTFNSSPTTILTSNPFHTGHTEGIGTNAKFVEDAHRELILHGESKVYFGDSSILQTFGQSCIKFFGNSFFEMNKNSWAAFRDYSVFTTENIAHVAFRGAADFFCEAATFCHLGWTDTRIASGAQVHIEGCSAIGYDMAKRNNTSKFQLDSFNDENTALIAANAMSAYQNAISNNNLDYITGGHTAGAVSLFGGTRIGNVFKPAIRIRGASLVEMLGCPRFQMQELANLRMYGSSHFEMLDDTFFEMTGGSKFIMENNMDTTGKNGAKYSPVVRMDPHSIYACSQSAPKTFEFSDNWGTATGSIIGDFDSDETIAAITPKRDYLNPVAHIAYKDRLVPLVKIENTAMVHIDGGAGAQGVGSVIVKIEGDEQHNGPLRLLMSGAPFVHHSGTSHEELHDGSVFIMKGSLSNKKPWDDTIDPQYWIPEELDPNHYDPNFIRPVKREVNGSPIAEIYDNSRIFIRGVWDNAKAPENWKDNVDKRNNAPLISIVDNTTIALKDDFTLTNNGNSITLGLNGESVTFTIGQLQQLLNSLS